MEYTNRESNTDSVLVQLIRHIIDMPVHKQKDLLNRLEIEAFEEETETGREDKRALYYTPVSFDFENFTYTGMIKDISVTGMFIETGEPFKIGQLIMVDIPDTTRGEHIRVAAEIVRTEPDGIGVRFISKTKGQVL
jgi:hypothetical protein